MRSRPRAACRGFTLLEAVVALVVLAFGMLAIAGFQLNLSRGSDIAKQRTEATRLAQEKMEELRSFEQIVTAAGKAAYADLQSSTIDETVATASNATYARSWTVSAPSTFDSHRTVSVMVAWTDRAGDADSVTLLSVISKANPADVGSLRVAAIEGGVLRGPKSRDINIPIRATKLGGDNAGYSTAGWPSGDWLVFNDVSGEVIAKCASEPSDSTDLSACTAFAAYLLSGFINDGNINGVANFAWIPTGALLTNQQDVIGTPDCLVNQATDPADAAVDLVDFKAYACLIRPSDHDSDDATPRRWSGKLNVLPAPVGAQKLCRFDRNDDDPATGVHQNITESLDNQNYVVIGAGACPAGTAAHQ